MTVQDYELLLRVRADLLEAVNGLKGLTEQIGAGDAATQKLGESADDATARIRAMVQASKEQADAQERVAESMRSINERAASPGVAPSGSGADVAAEAAAFNAAVAAKREAIQVLNAAFAGNIASAEGAAAAEAALDEAMAAGAISAREQAAYIKALDAAKVEDAAVTQAETAAVVENTAAMEVNAGVARELGVIIGELARGNTARLEGSMLTLANRTGLMTLLFNPLTLAITIAVGAFAAFDAIVTGAAKSNDSFNTSLAATGNFAGTSLAQIKEMSAQLATTRVSADNVSVALETIAASGKVGSGAFQAMGQAAVDMAELTGESADKAAQKVISMFDGTVEGVLKANDQYHFLTASIYEQIKALEDEGDTQSAMDVAAQAFHQAAMERQQLLQQELQTTGSWWESLKNKAAEAWAAMKNSRDLALAFGVASDQQKIDDLQERKRNAQPDANGRVGVRGFVNNMLGLGFGPSEQAQLDALLKKQEDLKKAQEDQAAKTKTNTDAVDAEAAIDRIGQSLDKNSAKQKALNDLTAQFQKLWTSNPDSPDLADVTQNVAPDGSLQFSGGKYDQLRADIEKKYAQKAPRAPRQKSDTAAVDAQQQLIKLLNDEQGALDPTAKAWADYNDKVAEANKLADKAKTARGADVQAINAQRDAVIANAAAIRDAAIDKIIDKDREAWEKLRDSLRTPVEVKTDKAQAQLQQLNDLMQKLKGSKDEISQADYDDALQRIGEQSITKAPQYKDPTKSTDAFGGLGATAGLGGGAMQTSLGNMGKAFEGLAKNFQAQDTLQTWYEDQLAAIAKDRDKDLQHHQLYLVQKAALDKQYADQSKAIDNARYNLGLSTASNFFGGLAELQHSKSAQMARVGKAAAIAQATINTYQAATGAYSAMASIPYVGPILGAIAAAAAIAAGLANIAQIRSASASFSEGGYTGPGGKYQVAGQVHAGEVVFSQEDVARHGGVSAVEKLRLGGLPGFASGGWVPPLPAAPEQPGLSSEVANAAASRNASPAAGGASDAGQTHIHVWSVEEAAQKLAEVPSFQTAVVHIVGENPRTIQGKWNK